MIWPKRAFMALGVFLLAAALLGAVPPTSEPQSERASLAGELLIASPDIGDPRFQRTVILLVRHSKDGALGIVINRPLGKYPLATLLERLGEKGATSDGDAEVFAGGPVQTEAAFVIHTTEYKRPETIAVTEAVAATSSKEIFRDISEHKGPSKTLIAFGYAGWGPDQLEAEMARGSWYTALADSTLIFDEKRERLWDVALERRLHDL